VEKVLRMTGGRREKKNVWIWLSLAYNSVIFLQLPISAGSSCFFVRRRGGRREEKERGRGHTTKKIKERNLQLVIVDVKLLNRSPASNLCGKTKTDSAKEL
jgi:hypothetical protein